MKSQTKTWPQADSLGRIISILDMLPIRVDHFVNEFSTRYGMSTRQCSYYKSAALWLEIITIEENVIISCVDGSDPYQHILGKLNSNKVFNKAIKSLRRGNLDKNLIALDILMYSSLGSSITTTHLRRAQTVISWVKTLKRLEYV